MRLRGACMSCFVFQMYALALGNIFLLLGVNVANADDQWFPIGPGERFVTGLVIDPQTPSTLYIGTSSDGVFRSTDGGNSWSAVNAGLTNLFIQALAIDPQTPSTLYAGTRDFFGSFVVGEIFRSTDGGESWGTISGLSGAITELAIDPETPTTLYATTLSFFVGSVFRSTNGGERWSATSNGLPTVNTPFPALAIDPQTSSTLYVGNRGYGVFRSANRGGSWSEINAGLTNLNIGALAIDPQTPTTLYAGTFGGGVFRSTDGGGSWSAINAGLTNLGIGALAIDPQTPTTLYAGTSGSSVFKLLSDEESDTSVTQPIPALTSWGMFLLAGLLGAFGFLILQWGKPNKGT